MPSTFKQPSPPVAVTDANGDDASVKRKRAYPPSQQKKKKRSLMGNFVSDIIQSIIKEELTKHLSRTQKNS